MNDAFLRSLDATIDRHAMLNHPFYQRWNAGTLDRRVLGEYARQYFAHVVAFPTYVSATHANCPAIGVRQMLLENLVEEERGTDNHPELWLRFAEALGVPREDVHGTTLLASTTESVRRFEELARRRNYLHGLAALYAYESQIPEVARTKREGLEKFYGVRDPRAVAFFRVHETADVVHRTVEREVLAAACTSGALQEDVCAAADEAARALWAFLDGVMAAYCV